MGHTGRGRRPGRRTALRQSASGRRNPRGHPDQAPLRETWRSSEQLPRAYVLWAAAGLSALVGLWFGGSVVESVGIQTLLAASAPQWGLRDPLFALDLSFFAFQLPLLRTGITFGIIVMLLVFTVCLGGYAATRALRWGRGGLVMGELPRIHLGALVAVFLVLVAARLWLGRYLLLLYGTSDVQEIFGVRRRPGPAAGPQGDDRRDPGLGRSGVLGGAQEQRGAGADRPGRGSSRLDPGGAALPLSRAALPGGAQRAVAGGPLHQHEPALHPGSDSASTSSGAAASGTRPPTVWTGWAWLDSSTASRCGRVIRCSLPSDSSKPASVTTISPSRPSTAIQGRPGSRLWR